MHPPEELDTRAEYYQTAQYVCSFNSRDGSVACKPFVRTFLKTGQSMTEITPVVNQGGRLPKTSHLRLDESSRKELLGTNYR
ncbi:hypothetical protein JCM3765_002384 [Sporobolomyces pararoseus]